MADPLQPNGLAPRFDHFHQTLDFLIGQGQYEAAAYLTQSLGTPWEIHEHLEEGIRYSSAVLTVIDSLNVPQDLKAALFLTRGTLKRHQSRYDEALSDYAAGTRLSFQNHDTMVKMLSGLGEIAYRQGDYPTAEGFYQRHLDISQQASDAKRIADAMNGLGRVALIQRGMDDALDYLKGGQELSQHAGYVEGVGWSFNAVGELERARKNYKEAIANFRESLALFQSQNNSGSAAMVKQNLAFALLATGEITPAETLFREVLAFWMQGQSLHGIALCLIGLAGVFQQQDRHLEAAVLLNFAHQELRRAGIQLELGDRCDDERAESCLQESLTCGEYEAVQERARYLTLRDIWQHTQLNADHRFAASPLTSREIELLRLIQLGSTDKQIAASLTISPHTVNTHLRSIYRKLGVNNRTAAVHTAIQKSLF